MGYIVTFVCVCVCVYTRPKIRWIDGILKDMEVLKVKNWKQMSRNRKEWNKLVEKAKTNPGL